MDSALAARNVNLYSGKHYQRLTPRSFLNLVYPITCIVIRDSDPGEPLPNCFTHNLFRTDGGAEKAFGRWGVNLQVKLLESQSVAERHRPLPAPGRIAFATQKKGHVNSPVTPSVKFVL